MAITFLESDSKNVQQQRTMAGAMLKPAISERTFKEFWAKLAFPTEALYDVQRVVANLRVQAREKKVQVVGVTSAVPGEGTSTVATMMALISAGMSALQSLTTPVASFLANALPSTEPVLRGTMLIDAQLRAPALHEIFNVANSGGLYERLHAQASLDDLIKRVAFSNLHILTVGQGWPQPLAQIDPEQFKTFVAELKTEYELVFVDLPPVHAHVDSVMLSRVCDGVVLVVQAGETRREVVLEAKKLLQKAQVNLLGTVLNRKRHFVPEAIYRRI